MTEREKRLFDALKNIAYDSMLCTTENGNYGEDFYMTECNDIQAARDLICEIEQEEANEQATDL